MQLRFLLLPCCIIPCTEAAAYDAFATGYEGSAQNTIYAFDTNDLSTPATQIVTDFGSPECITIYGSTVYLTSDDVYTFPIIGPYNPPTALGTGIEDPAGIAISIGGSFGLVTNPSGNIYSFPTSGGSNMELTTSTPIPAPLPIVIYGNTAYVGDSSSTNVYSFPVNDTSYHATLIQTLPDGYGDVSGLAVSNDGYLYMALADGPVYRVSLATPSGMATQVSLPPEPAYADGIAVSSDSKTVFMALDYNGIYSFPTGQDFPQTPVFLSALDLPGAFDLAITSNSMISVAGLRCNNLALANYLNQYGPSSTVALFSSLVGNALPSALESAAPTRNTLVTYASQNGYLASIQVVTDHLRQRRFRQQRPKAQLAAAEIPAEELLASLKLSTPPKPDSYLAWLGTFGEYTREKSQQQTPAFDTGVGGALLGLDFTNEKADLFGIGGAYIYTHIHEDNGMGHANLNQGYGTIYGTVTADSWYFDLALWAGYYRASNQREISFPGVSETAKSHIQGWQLAPHFEVGYDWDLMDWFGIEPFSMNDWVANWEDGFSEHGAPGLEMSQKERFCSLFRTETGLRLHEITTFSWGQLILREKGSYAYQKMFHTGQITALLIGSPGSFTVSTLTGAQNLGVGEFSMLFLFANPKAPYLSISYQGEFGSRYQSHQAIIEIGKDF